MLRIILIVGFYLSAFLVQGATCTIATNSNWTTCVCQETGVAPVSGDDIVVLAGVTLTINNTSPTPVHTGSLTIFGTVINNKANARWDGTVTVKTGGVLELAQKLDLGPSTSGCGYTLIVEGGSPKGELNLTGSGGSDLLSICGAKIAQSSGGCGPYPTGPLPYCEPTGGFEGPFTFNQNGLPIDLLYFNLSIPENSNRTLIEWATESEENFSHFEIQRAGKDLRWNTILDVQGAGYNTNSLKEYSVYDENPLIGVGYYRLKAVDIDGSYEYFSVKSVNHGGGRRLLVSPNPTTGSRFSYSINWDPGLYDRISLIDAIGNEVYSAPVTTLQNELQINKTLRPGAYLLRYTGSSFQEVTRVFIKD